MKQIILKGRETMEDMVDVEKLKIEVVVKDKERFLGLATIQLGEMRIKGFIIAQGPDKLTGKTNTYVAPPGITNRFGKRIQLFYLENEPKWQRLQERILEEYRNVTNEESEPF